MFSERMMDSNNAMHTPTLELTLPVHNEAYILEASLQTILNHISSLGLSYHIRIVDNGSTDGTGPLAKRLATDHPHTEVLCLSRPGRGQALRKAWLISKADIQAYMDIDLSTDLHCLASLLSPLINGQADLAIGSRLLLGSEVQRSLHRELISRTYAFLARQVTGVPISDFQCGFKAITRRASCHLLPMVQDRGWFFYTELIILAHRHGYQIAQLPVQWKEDPDSRVRIATTALHDLIGLVRMRRRLGTQGPMTHITHTPRE